MRIAKIIQNECISVISPNIMLNGGLFSEKLIEIIETFFPFW
jgi:hypothetical protein